MDIEFIIPAKLHSSRVPFKNWRPFYQSQCLVDITLSRLRAAGAHRIYLSCERCPDSLEWCRQNNVLLLERDPSLSANDVPLTKWIRSICNQVSGTADVAWCQVCDPFFDLHGRCLALWDNVRETRDSLVVYNPWKGYLLTPQMQPVGWSFGEHHTPSQSLTEWGTMPFTFSILKREAIKKTGYHIGTRPFWYRNSGYFIDIDTEDDFEFAAWKYAKMMDESNAGRR